MKWWQTECSVREWRGLSNHDKLPKLIQIHPFSRRRRVAFHHDNGVVEATCPMKKAKLVRHTIESLPPLTAKQRASLAALAGKPDRDIDTVDIRPLSAKRWRQAVRGHLCKPVKRQITARADADVLDWLKSQGKGYQSRINAILRREMLSSLK